MKAIIQDSAALREVRPLELAAYLRASGWRCAEETDKATYWTHEAPGGGTAEILVPRRRDVADFVARVSEALGTLEVVEERSQLEVLDDLSTTNSDVLRVRTHAREDDASGSIALEDGVLLCGRVRDMVLAAACSAVARRALFPRRKPTKALDYLHKVRLGQTERGSYVFTLISPVPPALADNGEGQEGVADEPFEREALTTLATGLEAALIAAERSVVTGGMEHFREAVGRGVSGNLCEALAGISEGSGGNDVEVSFSWTRSRPAPQNAPRRIVLPRDTAPILREAARVFRETAPLEDVEVRGVIIRLERPEGAPTGRVTVMGLIEDNVRRVTIELPERLYDEAILAHQLQVPVSCYGELRKEGNTYVLRNPREFGIQNDE